MQSTNGHPMCGNGKNILDSAVMARAVAGGARGAEPNPSSSQMFFLSMGVRWREKTENLPINLDALPRVIPGLNKHHLGFIPGIFE